MNFDTLHGLLNTPPFAPFELITSAGQSHRVVHPEFTVLTKTRIVIVDPNSDHMAVLPLLHITEARFESPAKA